MFFNVLNWVEEGQTRCMNGFLNKQSQFVQSKWPMKIHVRLFLVSFVISHISRLLFPWVSPRDFCISWYFSFLKLIFVLNQSSFVSLSVPGSQATSGKHGPVHADRTSLSSEHAPAPDMSRKCTFWRNVHKTVSWMGFLYSRACRSGTGGKAYGQTNLK